jgi:hypothetical protein
MMAITIQKLGLPISERQIQEEGVRKRYYLGLRLLSSDEIAQKSEEKAIDIPNEKILSDYFSFTAQSEHDARHTLYLKLHAFLGEVLNRENVGHVGHPGHFEAESPNLLAATGEKSVQVGHEADETDNLASAAQKTTKLQILEDLPQMLWKSGSFGPFKQGETIEIDSEIADILLKSGKVEEKKAENGN